ncbi:MAG: phosphopantetheine-binding protein [Actinomycetota bacterium]|nr:phosphopantetheine-binding protein [Actinomycetota bacterium]
MAELTEEMAVDAVNEVLASKRERWTPVDSSTLLERLDLDSLDVAELFATLEDRSGLDLDPDSANALRTVGDLARLRTV